MNSASRRSAWRPSARSRHYEAWLAAGRHGNMHWLASDKHRARRREPERLVAGIRSFVCVAMCHPPERDTERDARVGRIARYAAGEDYHRIMEDRLLELERWIQRPVPRLGFALVRGHRRDPGARLGRTRGALTRATAHDPDAQVREEASLAVAALG